MRPPPTPARRRNRARRPPPAGRTQPPQLRCEGGGRAQRGSAGRPRGSVARSRPKPSLPTAPNPAHLLAAALASLRGLTAGTAPPPRTARPRPAPPRARRPGLGAGPRGATCGSAAGGTTRTGMLRRRARPALPVGTARLLPAAPAAGHLGSRSSQSARCPLGAVVPRGTILKKRYKKYFGENENRAVCVKKKKCVSMYTL